MSRFSFYQSMNISYVVRIKIFLRMLFFLCMHVCILMGSHLERNSICVCVCVYLCVKSSGFLFFENNSSKETESCRHTDLAVSRTHKHTHTHTPGSFKDTQDRKSTRLN